jgi:hypothetical protein
MSAYSNFREPIPLAQKGRLRLADGRRFILFLFVLIADG